MIKNFAFFLSLSIIFCEAAQGQSFVLHGTITDATTGKPIVAASVFLSSTSIGTAADSKGEFTLHKVPSGKFDLVVSSLGYETFVQSINAEKAGEPLYIKLTQKANQLMDVVVGTYEKNGWEKWGKQFIDNFLGTSGLARECTIKNYKVIKFRFSKRRNTLEAFADEPILVENKALGYNLHYKMERFSCDFNKRMFLMLGYPLFEEMEGNARKQKRWKQQRKEAYFGSLMHFMRCLYANKLAENGYEVRRLEKIPNKERARIQALYAYYVNPDHSQDDFESGLPSDTLRYYKRILDQPAENQIFHPQLLSGDSIAYEGDSVTVALFFNDYLHVIYKNKKVAYEYTQQVMRQLHDDPQDNITSQLYLVEKRPVYVTYNGVYYQPTDVLTLGYWAWSEKISSLLPFDYMP